MPKWRGACMTRIARSSHSPEFSNNDAAREILDTAREALRIKEPVAVEKVFDFSLGAEALR